MAHTGIVWLKPPVSIGKITFNNHLVYLCRPADVHHLGSLLKGEMLNMDVRWRQVPFELSKQDLEEELRLWNDEYRPNLAYCVSVSRANQGGVECLRAEIPRKYERKLLEYLSVCPETEPTAQPWEVLKDDDPSNV